MWCHPRKHERYIFSSYPHLFQWKVLISNVRHQSVPIIHVIFQIVEHFSHMPRSFRKVLGKLFIIKVFVASRSNHFVWVLLNFFLENPINKGMVAE